MNIVILIAGGSGSRVGASVPKQFINVLGKPIIAYTLQKLQQNSDIDAIELVCVDGYQDTLNQIVSDYKFTKVLKVVTGGIDYEHSIINGVEGLRGVASIDDVIMIHWAASPFVTHEIIKDSIRVCKEKGNAISAYPACLLYGVNNGDHADDVIDRDSFMVLSAPQSFLYQNIVEFYKQIECMNLFSYVEAHTTSLMAELKWPIYFSKGDQTNIKITTPEDVKLFEGYVLYEQLNSKKDG